jgi:hypothetical protein
MKSALKCLKIVSRRKRGKDANTQVETGTITMNINSAVEENGVYDPQ